MRAPKSASSAKVRTLQLNGWATQMYAVCVNRKYTPLKCYFKSDASVSNCTYDDLSLKLNILKIEFYAYG